MILFLFEVSLPEFYSFTSLLEATLEQHIVALHTQITHFVNASFMNDIL